MRTVLTALAGITLLTSSAYSDVRVGVAGPFTGSAAAFGEQLKRGATQAAADLNAAGGINGEKIVLEFGDDAADPKQGVAVANQLVGNGVRFVLGHFNSGVSIPASDVYAENGTVAISPASTNPKLTERGLWNVFRTCGRDDQQGKIAGDYIATHFKDGKIALIHDKTAYGQGLVDETKKSLNGHQITEVSYDGINAGEKDYSAVITKLKGSRVDVIYFGGLQAEAGILLRQIQEQGLKAQFIGGEGLATSELASIAGDGVEGALFTFPPDPRTNPAAADAVKHLRDSGFEPESYTLYTYAALQVVAGAAKAANSLESKTVADAIRTKGPFKTVIGDLEFDQKGDIARSDYLFYRWSKGADGKLSYAPIQQ